MTDVHQPKIRSYNMSRIRGKDTKPELTVRKFLFKSGFRFRLHDKRLPSKPDIVLARYRTVIFVHGCFWHGHEGCKYFVIPKTRTKWWKSKIKETNERDRRNTKELIRLGWRVLSIWECELRGERKKLTLKTLLSSITASEA